MADSDKTLELLIKLGVLGKNDAAAAKQLIEETKAAAEQNTAATKEGTKATEKAGEATEKTTGFHKKWKDAIKGVQHEFPMLAHLAHMALSPITLSVAALVTSFGILREKLQSVGQVMATTAWGTDTINEAAAAWNKYADAVGRTKADTDKLAKNLGAIAQMMALIKQLGKDQGKDTESNPMFDRREKEIEAAEMQRTAAEIRKKAEMLRKDAAAAEPKSSEQRDKNTQKSLEAESAEAARKKAEVDAEIAHLKEIYSAENKGDPRYLIEHAKAAAKYGAFTDPQAIIATKQQESDSFQAFIERAAENQRRNDTNISRRGAAGGMRSKADELEAEAAKLEADAKKKEFDAQLNFYQQSRAQGITPNVTPTGQGFGVTSEVKAYYDRANRDLAAIGNAWAAAVAALKAQADATARNAAATSSQVKSANFNQR